MNIINKKIELSDGRIIEIETGKLAKQADGSVVVKMGGTMLLACVTCAKDAKPDVDFMPLQVDYKEKFASAGRFPGGFMKREGKASDSEILTARLVDRALRPLFPEDFHAEVFVTINLISAEKDIQPDALAGLAASSALAVSDIPFGGPISEVRVARINGEFKVNPNFSEMENCDLDIMVAATYDNIMMVEGEMNEVSEAEMLEAIKFAHEEIKKHCKVQMELMEEAGKTVKRTYCHEENDEELRKSVESFCYDRCYAIAKSGLPKHERSDAFDALKEEFYQTLPEEDREAKQMIKWDLLTDQEWTVIRQKKKVRIEVPAGQIASFSRKLPEDWDSGYQNVTVVCVCESQQQANRQIPAFLEIPIWRREIKVYKAQKRGKYDTERKVRSSKRNLRPCRSRYGCVH